MIQYLEYLNEEEKCLGELIEYNPADFQTSASEVEAIPVTEVKSKKSNGYQKQENFDSHTFEKLSIPPPPPPPMIDSFMKDFKNVGTDEALHSMLLSWYMSGYHTGYYMAKSQK